MEKFLQIALKYTDLGYSPIPILPPKADEKGKDDNKKAFIKWKEFQTRKPTEKEIREWATEYPTARLALVTGANSRLTILDCDTTEAREQIEKYLPDNFITPIATTPRGGQHLYFAYEETLPTKAGILPGLDVRNDGGMIMAPPSPGLNGTQYRWLEGLALSEVSPAEMPPALLDFLKKHLSPAKPKAINAVNFTKGTRDETLFHLALVMAKDGMPREEVEKQTIEFAKNCNPPETAQKALIKVKSAFDRLKNKEQDISALVNEYLLDEFDGGIFKISDLRRELGLNDKQYTLARQCVKRMTQKGLVEKHGHQLGSYRVVDTKKTQIEWNEIKAQASNLILPGKLHEVTAIRDGDMIAIAGFKNHSKTALAIETIRLNLDNFHIHFFITEYQARMKKRLLDFGINLDHPNFHSYRIEKSDYIPDKIESGPGVLNVIDHFPNLDNFWKIGKYQDEIHRILDGAICIVTHQKNKIGDIDALGGSFWRITPTLAVSLFWNDMNEYQGKMLVVKAKEPRGEWHNANGLKLDYKLIAGHEFEYKDWKK